MHEYLVELRIYGKDLEPAAVTKELGLQPSIVKRAGDAVSTKRIDCGLWAYNGSESGEPIRWNSLDEGLEFVIKKLGDSSSRLKSYKDKYHVVFWCGHFQSSFDGGPLLSPALLRDLGEFGVPVFIDNYFSSEGDGGDPDSE